MGARAEAREAIESGLALAHAIGSTGAIRHGRMNLLGWTAAFGSDPVLDSELVDPRSDADAAAESRWVTHDRATLGMLFYRGCEWLASSDERAPERARSLFKLTTEAYRATGNHDLLPVALGLWAQAEQRCGQGDTARELAEEAAGLIEQGAPSLLNESPVFVALHDAYLASGDQARAIEAIKRGLGPLTRRLAGLKKTSYARSFLSELGPNATLLARAREHGLTPPEIAVIDP
jgi:hypothetical protein